MSTTTVYSTAADGYLKSSHATYSTARSGVGSTIVVVNTNSDIWIDQAAGYDLYCAYLDFDTSAIPDTDVVTAATLSLYPNADPSGGTPGTLEVYAYDWGGTLTSADWIPGASVAAMTLLASRTTTGWVSDARKALTSTAAFPAAINKTGTTYLYLCIAPFRTGDAPTGEDYFGTYPYEMGAAYKPMLVVEHQAAGAKYAMVVKA